MSYRDNLDLVIEHDGIASICKSETLQDALFNIVEREKWHGKRQSFPAGVEVIDAIEAYVESRADEIRQELAGLPTREQMEAEWSRDYRRSV